MPKFVKAFGKLGKLLSALKMDLGEKPSRYHVLLKETHTEIILLRTKDYPMVLILKWHII